MQKMLVAILFIVAKMLEWLSNLWFINLNGHNIAIKIDYHKALVQQRKPLKSYI